MKKALLLIIVTAILLSACASNPPAAKQPPDQITLLMNFTIDGQHAPFYVARDKGFFAEQNIEIKEILKGVGSNDTVSKIIAGSADVGFAHTVPIVQAIGEDQPVKIVMGFYPGELCALYTRAKGANVQTVQDLAKIAKTGKYGGPPADLCYQMLIGVGDAAGVDLRGIQLVNVTADARIALLAKGDIDMAGTYYTGITAFRKGLEQAGEQLVIMRMDQYVQVYGNSIVVNTKMIKEKPDLVQRVVTAILKGLQYTVDHPDEAEQLMMKNQPQLDKEFNHESLQAMVTQAIWDETTKSKGLGMIDEAKMTNTITTIGKYWPLKRVPKASEVYTNDYVLQAQKVLNKK
jgi:NitT/TauT family transport system substrate-binding protein